MQVRVTRSGGSSSFLKRSASHVVTDDDSDRNQNTNIDDSKRAKVMKRVDNWPEDGLILPDSIGEYLIIEHTAAFVNKYGEQMEIRMKLLENFGSSSTDDESTVEEKHPLLPKHMRGSVTEDDPNEKTDNFSKFLYEKRTRELAAESVGFLDITHVYNPLYQWLKKNNFRLETHCSNLLPKDWMFWKSKGLSICNQLGKEDVSSVDAKNVDGGGGGDEDVKKNDNCMKKNQLIISFAGSKSACAAVNKSSLKEEKELISNLFSLDDVDDEDDSTIDNTTTTTTISASLLAESPLNLVDTSASISTISSSSCQIIQKKTDLLEEEEEYDWQPPQLVVGSELPPTSLHLVNAIGMECLCIKRDYSLVTGCIEYAREKYASARVSYSIHHPVKDFDGWLLDKNTNLYFKYVMHVVARKIKKNEIPPKQHSQQSPNNNKMKELFFAHLAQYLEKKRKKIR